MAHHAEETELPLHNDHNVYILGAGFSADAGLPMIPNFLVQMRDSHDWLRALGRNKEADSIARVLKFRLDAASAAYWANLDLENIEELFSLASASDTKITDDIRVAVAATLDYARKNNKLKYQIELTLSPSGSDDGRRSRELLSKFMQPETLMGSPPSKFRCPTYNYYLAKMVGMLKNGEPQGENTFISFNYDTLVEDALVDLGLGVSYGSKMGTHPRSKSGKTVIPVFKLHGSINWKREKNNSIRILPDYCHLEAQRATPEIIPPTWKKVFGDQIEAIWSDSLKKLSSATRIIIIGFSMPATDVHFKYLLAAGLRENFSLRHIVFVNPDKASLEVRAKSLLRQSYIQDERIRFVASDFMDFCSNRNRFHKSESFHGLGRVEADYLQYSFNWTNKPDS
jgi:hypothetical protein